MRVWGSQGPGRGGAPSAGEDDPMWVWPLALIARGTLILGLMAPQPLSPVSVGPPSGGEPPGALS